MGINDKVGRFCDQYTAMGSSQNGLYTTSHFSYALKLYNENFFDIAAQQFSIFINRYPGSERLPDARYYYGDALHKLGDIENARIEFHVCRPIMFCRRSSAWGLKKPQSSAVFIASRTPGRCSSWTESA